MFNEYEKDGRIIQATSFAYDAIYKAQGYKPCSTIYTPFNAIPMFSFTAEPIEIPADAKIGTTPIDFPTSTFTFPDSLTAEVLSNGQGHGNSKDSRTGNATKSRNKRAKA